MSIHARDRKVKGKPRHHFKPLSEIVRNARGHKIGRLLRLRPHKFDAYGIATFRTKREAIAAIRATAEARR